MRDAGLVGKGSRSTPAGWPMGLLTLAVLTLASTSIALVAADPVFGRGPMPEPAGDLRDLDEEFFDELGISGTVVSARYSGPPGGPPDLLLVKVLSSDGKRIERRVFDVPSFARINVDARDARLREQLEASRRADAQAAADALLRSGSEKLEVLIRIPSPEKDLFLNKVWFEDFLGGRASFDDLASNPEVRALAKRAMEAAKKGGPVPGGRLRIRSAKTMNRRKTMRRKTRSERRTRYRSSGPPPSGTPSRVRIRFDSSRRYISTR